MSSLHSHIPNPTPPSNSSMSAFDNLKHALSRCVSLNRQIPITICSNMTPFTQTTALQILVAKVGRLANGLLRCRPLNRLLPSPQVLAVDIQLRRSKAVQELLVINETNLEEQNLR